MVPSITLGSQVTFRKVYEEPILVSQQPSATPEEKALGEARASEVSDKPQVCISAFGGLLKFNLYSPALYRQQTWCWITEVISIIKYACTVQSDLTYPHTSVLDEIAHKVRK